MMKTEAIRIYGEKDLRLDSFELPEIGNDEILAKIISDSVCMSTYKLAQQGNAHKRVYQDLAEHPAVVGHELCGIVVEVGEKWKNQYQKGMKFTVQPGVVLNGVMHAVGYNYELFGGDATWAVIPSEVMEADCLIPFRGESFFEASLSEPASCIIAGYHRMYHTSKQNHEHTMGVKKGGATLVFGACGPMGLECLDYGLQLEDGSDLVVAVDVNDTRLERAERMLRPAVGSKRLVFVNTAKCKDPEAELRELTGGKGYDDIFVYAPVESLIEQADHLLAEDGCLNFFAGPVDKTLSARVNFYNVHYSRTHTVGFTGSTTQDVYEALGLMEQKRIRPAIMITHIGGLESAIETTLNVPKIPGGKKLIYPHINLPLTAIEDFRKLGETDPLFAKLADSCDRHQGCWNAEAEKLLLEHYQVEA